MLKPVLERDPEEISRQRFIDPALIDEAAGRTLLVSSMGHPDWVKMVERFFGPRAPVMATPQNAARALAAMCEYREWRETRRA